jgi:hypothetical protein
LLLLLLLLLLLIDVLQAGTRFGPAARLPAARADTRPELRGADGAGGLRLGLPVPSRTVIVERDPGVFGTPTLAGVDDEAAFSERHSGEPTRHHPDLLAVVDCERTEVKVTRGQMIVGAGRGG